MEHSWIKNLAILAAVLLCGVGCEKSPPIKGYVIKWTGGPNLIESDFYFNEVYCGFGKKGFEVILAKLEGLPDATSVRIDYPPEALAFFEEISEEFHYMPLRKRDAELQAWIKLAQRKNLTFAIGFAPDE